MFIGLLPIHIIISPSLIIVLPVREKAENIFHANNPSRGTSRFYSFLYSIQSASSVTLRVCSTSPPHYHHHRTTDSCATRSCRVDDRVELSVAHIHPLTHRRHEDDDEERGRENDGKTTTEAYVRKERAPTPLRKIFSSITTYTVSHFHFSQPSHPPVGFAGTFSYFLLVFISRRRVWKFCVCFSRATQHYGYNNASWSYFVMSMRIQSH